MVYGTYFDLSMQAMFWLAVVLAVWFIVGLVFTRVKQPSCGRCGTVLEGGDQLHCSACDAELRIVGIKTSWMQVRARGRVWQGCLAWWVLVFAAGLVVYEYRGPLPVRESVIQSFDGAVRPSLPTLDRSDLDTFDAIRWYQERGDRHDPAVASHRLLRIEMQGHKGESCVATYTTEEGWRFSDATSGYTSQPRSTAEVLNAFHEVLGRICPDGPAERVGMQAEVLYLQAMDSLHGHQFMNMGLELDRLDEGVLELGTYTLLWRGVPRLALRGAQDVPVWIGWGAAVLVPPMLIVWRRRRLWRMHEGNVGESA